MREIEIRRRFIKQKAARSVAIARSSTARFRRHPTARSHPRRTRGSVSRIELRPRCRFHFPAPSLALDQA